MYHYQHHPEIAGRSEDMMGYQGGRITRRSLLLSLPALPALVVARKAFAQAAGSTLRARGLNQMTLGVSNVKRSLDFYQGLFGMPIQARQGAALILRIGAGPQFLALSEAGTGQTPSIRYLGMAVENFSVDGVLKTLADHGIVRAEGTGVGLSGGPMKVRVRMRGPEAGGAPGGTPEIFFGDQDGIVVQLQDPKYGGGAGVLGDVFKVEPAPAKGLLAVKDMSHFTLSASDGARSNQFYKELFGIGFRSYQGPTAPTLAIGPAVEFLMFGGGGGGGRTGAAAPPPRPASINHACMNMDNFNVERIQKALESYGIQPREGTTGPVGPMRHYVSLRMENRGGAKEGTPELYFTDPDGILIQLQDVAYCGGGGYLGNVCPAL
jgi:catechol 2,3-dioxygenase-like lactoylglutathione lyase family enzyme